MHYITNDWELGELHVDLINRILRMVSEEVLLDFREITGEHSGENMAHIVFDTLKFYGLEDKVCAL